MSKFTFAFYNLENLFDTRNDPQKLDEAFTPKSEKKWTKQRLEEKVTQLGKVIKAVGSEETSFPPLVLGVAEVENKRVLHFLKDSKHLKKYGYDFVHYNSPDERGIDTALLFRRPFKVLSSKAVHLPLKTPEGQPDHTRDILHVHGTLEETHIHLLVNHWPSRSAGVAETASKRMQAAQKNKELVTAILTRYPEARIIVMGDFNDDPQSDSVRHLMGAALYNPMELLLTRDDGSLNFRGDWFLFDQLMMSNNCMKPYDNPFAFDKAGIFTGDLVEVKEGRYKGDPFRTYAGPRYLGGVSDHFPVYAIFDVED